MYDENPTSIKIYRVDFVMQNDLSLANKSNTNVDYSF